MAKDEVSEFRELESIYGRSTASIGPMSRRGWLVYWRALEDFKKYPPRFWLPAERWLGRKGPSGEWRYEFTANPSRAAITLPRRTPDQRNIDRLELLMYGGSAVAVARENAETSLRLALS